MKKHFERETLMPGMSVSRFYMIGNCALAYKNAPRGCTLGTSEIPVIEVSHTYFTAGGVTNE